MRYVTLRVGKLEVFYYVVFFFIFYRIKDNVISKI